MKWDEVEREFFVIGVQLGRLSSSFMCLAAALRRERESVTQVVTRGHSATGEPKQAGPGPSDQALLFPEDPFS